MIEVEPGVYSLLARRAGRGCRIIVPWNALASCSPLAGAGAGGGLHRRNQAASPPRSSTDAVMRCFADVPQCPGRDQQLQRSWQRRRRTALDRRRTVDVLSFTGSSPVGKRIMAAAAGTLKRLISSSAVRPPQCIRGRRHRHNRQGACRRRLIQCGQQCTAIIASSSMRAGTTPSQPRWRLRCSASASAPWG